jgi:hypothetical protein
MKKKKNPDQDNHGFIRVAGFCQVEFILSFGNIVNAT